MHALRGVKNYKKNPKKERVFIFSFSFFFALTLALSLSLSLSLSLPLPHSTLSSRSESLAEQYLSSKRMSYQ